MLSKVLQFLPKNKTGIILKNGGGIKIITDDLK